MVIALIVQFWSFCVRCMLSLQIHRVERSGNTYELKVVEKRYQDQLFGGDSYVILYTYLAGGKENYIIYFWLVCNCCYCSHHVNDSVLLRL